ncbi:MAG TPA: MarR family transcriptional regulator [Dermatophilaceae bacterium]|jgi:DNA-binding MarR family transcriptional regulator|nr:MarR family transcriptional regulator [Dermatophilaceae bacterium]
MHEDLSSDAPRWLDADERLTWLVLVSLLQTLPGALDAQLQRDSGLSFFEYMVLAMLSEQEDRTLRMSRLAAVTNGSMSRLSHVAAKLERRGLLRREPCPGDGRAINAVLTDAGWETVVAAAPRHVNRVRELVLDPLTRTQQVQLRAVGSRILDAVSPAGERLPVGGR